MKYNYLYKTEPYEKQAEAFFKAYDKEYFALFMQQGTGKTKVTIDLASNYYIEGKVDAVLVIAPNGVQDQWHDEQIDVHSPVDVVKFLWSSKKTKKFSRELDTFMDMRTSRLKWFCVNVEAFSSGNAYTVFKEYCKKHNVMIVIDEATRIKTPTSKRFFNIAYGLNEFRRQGRAIKGVNYLSKYRVILTGTMVTNSVYDLWAMFEFLRFNYFGINYFGFKQKYGIEVQEQRKASGQTHFYKRGILPHEMKMVRAYHSQGYNIYEIAARLNVNEYDVKYIIDHPNEEKPYKNLDELKKAIDEHCIIVRKEECLDLPPKVYEKIFVHMSAEQKRVYKDLKDELLSVYAHKELTVANKLTLMTRLQQVTGGFFPYSEDLNDPWAENKGPVAIGKDNPKIEAIKMDLEETADEQIIIWSRFTAEIKSIISVLRQTYPEKNIQGYFGEVPKEERRHTIDQFKKGEVDILIGNSKMGIGLNLQCASIQYYFSNSYSLETREQSEDRTHRGGQTKTCVYKDLIVRGTVDEKVYKALIEHRSLLEYFRGNNLEDFVQDVEY